MPPGLPERAYLPGASASLWDQLLELLNARDGGFDMSSRGCIAVAPYEGAAMFGAKGFAPYLLGSGYAASDIPAKVSALPLLRIIDRDICEASEYTLPMSDAPLRGGAM